MYIFKLLQYALVRHTFLGTRDFGHVFSIDDTHFDCKNTIFSPMRHKASSWHLPMLRHIWNPCASWISIPHLTQIACLVSFAQLVSIDPEYFPQLDN